MTAGPVVPRRRVAVVGARDDGLTAALAAVLGEDHDVDALPAGRATVEGRGYDLVVACARDVVGRACGARRGVLVVAAADPALAPARDADDPPVGARTVVVPGAGTGPADSTGVRWLDGDALLHVYGPIGELHELEVRFLRSLPAGVDAVPLEVEVDGRPTLTAMLRRGRPGDPAHLELSVPVEGLGPLRPVAVRIRSGPAADVPVAVARADLPRPLDRAARRRAPAPAPWWQGWDVVVAGSSVASRWLAHAWQVPAPVVHPPVDLPPAADPAGAEPIIVVPGPFGGVPYKQAELIGVFQVLAERGHLPGWELHLVGSTEGDADKAVRRTRSRAAGTPGVVVHLDPTPAEEAELLGRAAIAWSAVGIGEDTVAEPGHADPSAAPVLRAMAAGAVPIVVRGAAADGIVEHRANGFVVPSLAQLLAATEELAEYAEVRAHLGRSAARTAAGYGGAGFAERVRAVLAPLLAG